MYQSVHGAAQASKDSGCSGCATTRCSKAAHRPTDDEQHAARRVLDICKEVKLEPPLIAPSTRPDTKVVACALALYFGQKFESEAKAKEAFGLGASTDVRRRWVEDKLPRLFEHRPAAKTRLQQSIFPQLQRQHMKMIVFGMQLPVPLSRRRRHPQRLPLLQRSHQLSQKA